MQAFSMCRLFSMISALGINAGVGLMLGAFGAIVSLASFANADAAPHYTKASKVAKPVNLASGIVPPKLVLVVIVDGLPQEQLLKNYDLFVPDGFRRLMDHGARFTDAHQGHAFTVTAVGHAAVLTGAYPYQHGIIANEWRDRDGKSMYCVQDERYKYLDGSSTTDEDGTSPRNLRVSTVGDELRYATNNQSKVFAVSGKDRGAILLAGKTGTAYMYMSKTGSFSSSSYYMAKHPDWVTKYFESKPQDKYFKKVWEPLLEPKAYERSVSDGQAYSTSFKQLSARFGMQYGTAMEFPNEVFYGQLLNGPFGDEMTANFAKALAANENLGRNPAGATDILGVSFSSHDYVNHNFGPESMQSQDHLLRLDRQLADFFQAIDQRVGKENVLVVLTADHGFMNVPEYSQARQFDAQRVDAGDLRNAVNQALEIKFGVPKLVKQSMTGGLTLDYAAAEAKGVSRDTLEQAASHVLMAQSAMNYVFTRTQLEAGNMPDTRIGKLVVRSWDRHAAIDLVTILKPFNYFQSKTTKTPVACSHGTPYSYDTNVPLMIQGAAWIKPGRYTAPAEVVDIAPTLSAILNTRPPSAAEGRALTEAIKMQAH